MYWLRRGWAEVKSEVLVLPSRTLVLAWAFLLLALPLVYSDAYVLRILTLTCLFAMFAASWDLLAGYAGQVNFGHALFFGAGAYVSALLQLNLGLSPWITVWIGALGATLFGILVGFLCLRLRGSYLSLATLAFPLIAIGLLFAFPGFSGGELGISGLKRLAATPLSNYYVAVLAMLAVVFAAWLIADSKFGLVLHAIRDDEVAARASGINTPRYKLTVFAISAFASTRRTRSSSEKFRLNCPICRMRTPISLRSGAFAMNAFASFVVSETAWRTLLPSTSHSSPRVVLTPFMKRPFTQ